MTAIVEPITEEVNEEPTPESQDQVWERTALKTAPITKEELRGDVPTPEESPVLPDRALVAPEISEYFQAHETPQADPALSEIAALRDRLEELAAPAPEPTSEMQQLIQKIASLEERDNLRTQEAQERAAQEQEEARLSTFREGVIGNIRAEGDQFPGLIALSLEDNVYHTVINESRAGNRVSELEVASKAEEELWGLYDTLHAIKTRATSDQEQPSEAPKPITTLTPNLTADDEPWSLQDAMAKGKKEAQAELWARVHANQ